METSNSNFQVSAEEDVFTARWVVAEGGGAEPRHKQVSYWTELALSM